MDDIAVPFCLDHTKLCTARFCAIPLPFSCTSSGYERQLKSIIARKKYSAENIADIEVSTVPTDSD